MAWTSCRMAARSFPTSLRETALRVVQLARSLPLEAPRKPEARRALSPEDLRDEPVSAVYSAAGRDHASYGRRPTRGLGRFPAIARLRITAGRLPHHSGANVLSRRQPRRHGLLSHCATRTPVRPDPRPEPDDFDEFLR